ncbi:MAG: hypothetical protein ACREB9_00160 [Thermoplasmata archaeon]
MSGDTATGGEKAKAGLFIAISLLGVVLAGVGIYEATVVLAKPSKPPEQ